MRQAGNKGLEVNNGKRKNSCVTNRTKEKLDKAMYIGGGGGVGVVGGDTCGKVKKKTFTIKTKEDGTTIFPLLGRIKLPIGNLL